MKTPMSASLRNSMSSSPLTFSPSLPPFRGLGGLPLIPNL